MSPSFLGRILIRVRLCDLLGAVSAPGGRLWPFQFRPVIYPAKINLSPPVTGYNNPGVFQRWQCFLERDEEVTE